VFPPSFRFSKSKADNAALRLQYALVSGVPNSPAYLFLQSYPALRLFNCCTTPTPLWSQNALGLVVAGALAGYVYLQRQETTEAVEEISGKLSGAQESINSLRGQVHCCFLPDG